jgi:phenylpropionate dioxygenase-like ring-hydroxylating dioxygenase large terminal subunit
MLYTRNDWYVACTESDLTDRGPVAACILNERLAIWRSGDRIVALEDRCVHRAAALSLGRCEGANLRCLYHGLLFDPAGKVVEIPGQELIPPQARVRAYPVTTRYGWVWVWMGEPAKADPSLVPDLFPGVSLDDFVTGRGVLDFQAQASLISDNLLDFSHLPYVHASTFQAPLDWSQSAMSATALERGVHFERWIENGRGGSFLYPSPAERFDEWLGYDYLFPGVLLMWVGIFPAGAARATNFGRPDFSSAIGQVQMNVQAITPMTERTSRYHFLIGMHRTRAGDVALLDKLVSVITQAFHEDKRTIEAQQQVLDRDPQRPLMPTVHDRGVTLYHRIKARLLAQERENSAPSPQSLAGESSHGVTVSGAEELPV